MQSWCYTARSVKRCRLSDQPWNRELVQIPYKIINYSLWAKLTCFSYITFQHAHGLFTRKIHRDTLSTMVARHSIRNEEEKNCWIKSLFLFYFVTKIILVASYNYGWTPDVTYLVKFTHQYFTDVLAMFLDHNCVKILAVYGRVRELLDLIINSLICVPKMNKGLMGLEQHESE